MIWDEWIPSKLTSCNQPNSLCQCSQKHEQIALGFERYLMLHWVREAFQFHKDWMHVGDLSWQFCPISFLNTFKVTLKIETKLEVDEVAAASCVVIQTWHRVSNRKLSQRLWRSSSHPLIPTSK